MPSIVIVLSLLCSTNAAHAQEAMYTAAATMPSPRVTLIREQVNFTRFGSDPSTNTRRTDNLDLDTNISLGLVRGLALYLDVPAGLRWQTDSATGKRKNDHGISDLDAMLKWRFYQDDSGGINTLRIALLAGAEFASGDDEDFSSGSINPHLGVVLTNVKGRHGFNQEFHFQLNTHGDDGSNFGGEGAAEAFRSNTSYLYRIDPARFTAESKGAWYATIELNALYETNGDVDLRWAPGLMYEHLDYALEFMAQFPLYQRVNHRADLVFSVGMGVRFSF
jgi:hypothetical protein